MDIDILSDDLEWDAGTDGESFIRTFQGPVNDQAQSIFFRLPPELRRQIYQEYFRGSFVAILSYLRRSEPRVIAINPEVIKPGLASLLVCRQMYPEAIEAFFNMCELGLTNGQHSNVAAKLLDSLYPRVKLGVKNVHLARIFCGGYLRFPVGGDPARMEDFRSGIDFLAQHTSLQSVVVGAGWDTDVESDEKNKEHALRLEEFLRKQVGKLSKASHVCVWMGWPRPEGVGGAELESLPANFHVHRVLYRRCAAAKKYRLVDEDQDGKVVEGKREACSYCNDVAKPWDGYAQPEVGEEVEDAEEATESSDALSIHDE